ncbi:hypothetical protein GC102_36385 [Paenibacillus sp. LMG 31460]|uniref:Uncharacterized protein n=1 Tax=Paenibacillus germinis TaxID=2654979 RepID=A0ABX1ZDK5_9BACL|nr:hypothetical protein [Paenibacillus germinis]NOU91167.1 hypothetical protein [Paenibacillus germinis]
MVFDPRSEQPDFFLIKAYEVALNVINRVNGAENEYVKNMEKETEWVTNPYLRRSPIEYSLFLKNLSLKTRRRFLFLSARLTTRDFVKSIGFSSTTRLQKYLKMNQYDIGETFLARMAVFHRVPRVWLMYEKVDDFWDSDQFYTSDYPIIYGISELMKLLKEDTNSDFWVRGLVMNNRRGSRLFLRIENQKGNFLIEFSNEIGVFADFQEVVYELKNCYESYEGYIDTIYPQKRNAAILCKSNNEPFKTPIGLYFLNKSIQMNTIENGS